MYTGTFLKHCVGSSYKGLIIIYYTQHLAYKYDVVRFWENIFQYIQCCVNEEYVIKQVHNLT